MTNNNFGRDQFIINDPTGKISIAPLQGPLEITVTGVGENPPNYADYWVDRISYESQLRDRLITCSVTQIVADGGFGKSSLAAWAFDRVTFDKRVWVCFRQEHTFDRFARFVLQELGRPVKDPQANEERLLRELVLRLNDPNIPVKMLVVMDQFENAIGQPDGQWYESFVTQWSEVGQQSAVLVTSRSSVLSTSIIALTGFNEAEGIAFFDREKVTGEHRSELIGLASGHPLLLNLAAAWTKENYGARVDDRAIDFFGKLFANYQGDPTAGVSAIFDVLFEALPIALQGRLVKLSVYRLPIALEMAQAMDGTTIEDLELLVSRGLLFLQDERFVLHPLVESLVRSKLTEGDRRVAHEAAIGHFESNIKPASAEMLLEDCREELEIFHHACEIGDYQKAFSIYCTIDDFLDKRGFWTERVRLLESLVLQWEKTDDNRWEIGACLNSLGNAYDSLGQYQRAIDFYQQSIEIMREISDRNGEANSLGNLGNAYDSLGQYQRAIDFHQQSLEIAREIGDRNGEARSLAGLGIAYGSLSQYQRAIDFHQQSLEIARKIGDRNGEANSLGNLGNAYDSLGQYQRAIDFQQQSLEIAREIGDRNGEARSLGGLGIAYDSLSQYQRAIEFHQQHNEIAREIGDRNGEANSLFNMALSLGKIDNHSNALQNFQEAKLIYEDLQLDYMIEQCNKALRNCNRMISTNHPFPPAIVRSFGERTMAPYRTVANNE
jgi:tetratricopeptide (TPR) repeat protein